jgi:hypothetical protein
MTTDLETRVWLALSRVSPFQRTLKGVLRLDGETLSFEGDRGETIAMRLADAALAFPRSMIGMGFVWKVQGRKLYVWFSDPFSARETLLQGGDEDEANADSVNGVFSGRKAAGPWLRTLRAATG